MVKKQNCVIWIHGFIVSVKADHIYKYIAKDVEARHDTSNYTLDRQFSKAKIKKVIGLMNYKLAGSIVRTSISLRAKTYSYLIDDGSEDKQAKGTKKCVIKRKLKIQNYKNWLEAT